MPLLRRSAAAVLALVAFACNPPAAQTPAPVKLDTDDAKVIYSLGLLLAQRIETFHLSEPELATFEEGLRDGVLDRKSVV